MTALLFCALLWAGEITPWAAPWEVQQAYDGWREQRGQDPQALACEALWADEVRLCFRVQEGKKARRLLAAEAPPDAREQVSRGAADWVRAELERKPIDGMDASYWMLRDRAGGAIRGALAPEVLAEKLGLPLLAAIPSTGVLVAWTGGSPELDKVMAVGVSEMFAAASDPVSPVVFGWDGKRWFAFAEATPEQPSKPGNPAAGLRRPRACTRVQKRPLSD